MRCWNLLLVSLQWVDHDVGEAVSTLSDWLVAAVQPLVLVRVLRDQLFKDLVMLILLSGIALREHDDVRDRTLLLHLPDLVFILA